MKNFFRTCLIAMTAFSMAACSSTTFIRSTDSDAKIYIDGEYKGKGTASHTDTKTIGSVTSVRLEKAGCEPRSFQFSRNEEFDAGACAGGVFLLVPFLWVQRYKAERTYEFECEPKK